MYLLLGIYFILVSAITLFALVVDAKIVALLGLVIGIVLVVAGAYPIYQRNR
jgi:uncharacterized membrane protein